jgi:hypothetical protein
MLYRIVSMLTRLIARSEVVSETAAECNARDEHGDRDVEYEYKYEEGRKPKPSRAPKDGLQGFTNGNSIVRAR